MLAPLPDRPFGYGAPFPMHQAHWIHTHAVDRLEAVEPDEKYGSWSMRLHSGDESIRVLSCETLILKPNMVDGRLSLVILPEFIRNQIAHIVDWHRDNPGERAYGVPAKPLEHVGENVADLLLNGPTGAALIEAIDAELAMAPQSPDVRGMRHALRNDQDDAKGVSSRILAQLPQMA